jgi:citrate lyase beta subunit
MAFLAANVAEKRCDVGVRINAHATEDGQQDLKASAALALGSEFTPDFIMVPSAVLTPELAALPDAIEWPEVQVGRLLNQ